jgi:hypothetical protein
MAALMRERFERCWAVEVDCVSISLRGGRLSFEADGSASAGVSTNRVRLGWDPTLKTRGM